MSNLQDKRQELINIISDALKGHDNNNEIADYVVKSFAKISEPVKDEYVFMELITLKSASGLGGGKSRKTGNVQLNWRKLLTDSPEHYLTIVGAATSSYLIPLAGLVVWNKLWALRSIEISEMHAIVISALWELRDNNNYVDGKDLLSKINIHFKKHTKRELSNDELDIIISDLCDLRTIKLKSDGRIWLCEYVRKSY